MTDEKLTERTVRLALENVADGGKPFACLIVKDGEILVEAVNQVAQTGDSTAHAEIRAIRIAAEQGISDLSDCEFVVTAYPCPMCLGALYYAAPKRVLFAATREQEGEHYEDGNALMSLSTFYSEYAKPVEERNLRAEQIPVDDPQAPFRAWSSKHQD